MPSPASLEGVSMFGGGFRVSKRDVMSQAGQEKLCVQLEERICRSLAKTRTRNSLLAPELAVVHACA